MVEKKNWEEFQETGLLWWINMILHTFGWAIRIEKNEEKKIIDVYPARVRYRGFPDRINTREYIKVNRYMKENSEELYNEVREY